MMLPETAMQLRLLSVAAWNGLPKREEVMSCHDCGITRWTAVDVTTRVGGRICCECFINRETGTHP